MSGGTNIIGMEVDENRQLLNEYVFPPHTHLISYSLGINCKILIHYLV
jgi:hypothetical protein